MGMFHSSFASRTVMPASDKKSRRAAWKRPAASSSARPSQRKFFEQIAILFGMEIFSDAVHARKGQNIAPQFVLIARGTTSVRYEPVWSAVHSA